MAKLTANTVLLHPETLAPVALAEGDDLPEWAKGMVGDHLLDGPAPETEAPEDPYKGMKKDDLHAELEKRNADRADDAKIVPASDKNEDLVAALVADDAAQA